ncbi:hypothetical protein [Chitinophaga rhizosphaerae]|nr:hypothetical protein [Chitinophaga rhizosphaerae]
MEFEPNEPLQPGATIRREYDRCEIGLAWNPEIRTDRRFVELIDEIRKGV